MGSLTERVPWWIKIGAKIALARLPLSYSFWRRLGLFRHGAMLDPDYAIGVFRNHYERAKPDLPSSFSLLELGPGDSLATVPIAAAAGARSVILVDAGSYARAEIDAYRPLLLRLEIEPARYATVTDMLRLCGAEYRTNGLESLRGLPASSVDFSFSQAVLEHTPLAEFSETVGELWRVHAPGGISSHRIDLQDHLAQSLHSLRFRRSIWESKLFRTSGFYTNRLRASQIVKIFASAGFEILRVDVQRWPVVPLGRALLDAEFREMPDEDLISFSLDLLARKKP